MPAAAEPHNGIEILHSAVPGRVRFRVPAMRRCPDSAQAVERAAMALSGVVAASADDLIASLLVRFDPSITDVTGIRSAVAASLRSNGEKARRGEEERAAGPPTPPITGRTIGNPGARLSDVSDTPDSYDPVNHAGAPSRSPQTWGPGRVGPTSYTLPPAPSPLAPNAQGPTPPAAHIVHQRVPGRVRLRVPRIRHRPSIALYIEERMRRTRGVLAATAAPEAASVLVYFDPTALDPGRILQLVEHAALESEAPRPVPVPAPPAPGRIARMAARVTHRPAPAIPLPLEELSPTWHSASVERTVAAFHANPDSGLTQQDAVRRLSSAGRNEVPDIPRRPRSAIVRDQVTSVPSLMLTAGTAFSLVTRAMVDAVFIGGAVIANAVIGYLTEDYAERTIQSLRHTRTPQARILRDGRRTKVPIAQVVPGDVLLLEPGHVAAADGRVVRADDLVMDESLLTGESAGQVKVTGAIQPPNVPIGDRRNMVFAGSAVQSGKGAAVVTATGLNTELGRIRTMIGEAPDTPPPMTREMERLGGILALLSIAACGVFAVAGLAMGLPTIELLAVAASLAVSAIPEGLPTVATTTLALGMKRMRAQNVVMRRLSAVAALGSGTILCVDKTGTLTENRMEVRSYVLGCGDIEASALGESVRFVRKGHAVSVQDEPVLQSALEIGALCTEAELQRPPSGGLDAVGSATEQALLLTSARAGLDVDRLRSAYALLEKVSRASGRNYMATIHRSPLGADEVLVKGAPEEVLALCSRERLVTADGPLAAKRRTELLAENERLARQGQRVLALARGRIQPGESWREQDRSLTWIGLVGMEDPVRGSARDAIDRLDAAGIRTLMITGDQPITAETVGRQVGLGDGDRIRVATAQAIRRSRDTGERLPDVLCRVSPADKYEIVQILRDRGHVVMMTGDGINDAPALKAADVGIAMGVRSTQIARDIADVILLDDNLTSVPTAVGHGRTIYSNIRKALRFMLSSNLADLGLVGAALVLRLPFPVTALQLLWMNLVTDVFPAIALAMEPAEPDVMRQKPRPPAEPLLSRPMWRVIGRESALIAAATMGSYLWALSRYGAGARARTMAFSTVTLGELAYVAACRSDRPQSARNVLFRGNRPLGWCVGLSAGAQLLTFLPPLRGLLGIVPLAALDWLVVAAASAAVLGGAEALKRLPAPAESEEAASGELHSLPAARRLRPAGELRAIPATPHP